jgi:hypothetical protein
MTNESPISSVALGNPRKAGGAAHEIVSKTKRKKRRTGTILFMVNN